MKKYIIVLSIIWLTSVSPAYAMTAQQEASLRSIIADLLKQVAVLVEQLNAMKAQTYVNPNYIEPKGNAPIPRATLILQRINQIDTEILNIEKDWEQFQTDMYELHGRQYPLFKEGAAVGSKIKALEFEKRGLELELKTIQNV